MQSVSSNSLRCSRKLLEVIRQNKHQEPQTIEPGGRIYITTVPEAHCTFLPQTHTESPIRRLPKHILGHRDRCLLISELSNRDRRWLNRTLGHWDRTLLNRELSQPDRSLLNRTLGHRDRSLLNSELGNRDRKWLNRTLSHRDRSLLNWELGQRERSLLNYILGHWERRLLNRTLGQADRSLPGQGCNDGENSFTVEALKAWCRSCSTCTGGPWH